MQLLKAVVSTEPEISNEELLMLENEFLRDELELKDIENSIEIYECILDCIEKTGGVDKSLEVMFGENITSSENFEAEIKAQYESACESAYSMVFAKQKTSDMAKKLDEVIKQVTSLSKADLEKVKFPIKIEFTVRESKMDKMVDHFFGYVLPEMRRFIDRGASDAESISALDKKFDEIGLEIEESLKSAKPETIVVESSDRILENIDHVKKYSNMFKPYLKDIESTLVMFGKLTNQNIRAIAKAKKYLYTMARIYARFAIRNINTLMKIVREAK